jgi:C1A family cysteine protease
VYDQGQLSSCTANALCAAVQFDDPTVQGSRLFLYYNERMLEHDIPDDAGAQIYDGVKCLVNYGVCQETEWPYDISKFAVAPPPQCYTDALSHRAISAFNVQQNINAMKTCLVNGFPFVVGIAIYESFETAAVAATGQVPMPKPNEKCLGGHCVYCCGFRDDTQQWILANSWGSLWGGCNGYFYLDYAYLLSPALTSDLWTITAVSK